MPVIVTRGPSGGAPNRLEINDFVKHEKFFSLYVQALHILQTRGTQDDPGSFFQIAGIHGLPYVAWDGVTGVKPIDPGSNFGGYCNHGNVLFPTWHRPYVSLYEQLIQKYAKEVAASYTVDCAAWIEAAEKLRQPYWDWAVNAVPPDEVIALQKVVITGPTGHKITVTNPIYSYTFHPIDPSFPPEFHKYKATIRYPTGDGSVDLAQLKTHLKANQTSYMTSTYNMLSRVQTWHAFSNDRAGDGGSTSNSLEAIHNLIHFDIGGRGGHMSSVLMAAFDPIFFLHHCNVDRMLSLWKALHPSVWVTPGDSDAGTLTISANDSISQSTPLTPFRKTISSFWTSAGIEDTTRLGYTYPDFNGLDNNDSEAVKVAIGRIVNKLYSGSTSGFTSSQVSAAVVPAVPYDFHDWTARIQVKKYGLALQSFCVYIFLGIPPADTTQWDTCPNFVGSYFALVNSKAEQCANCIRQADVVIEGFVHLNHAIAEHSHLGSLDPEVIEPYLTKELHWRVMKVDGEPVDLKSLEISVFSTPFSYPPGAMFPVAGERCLRPGITHGRPGGCRHF